MASLEQAAVERGLDARAVLPLERLEPRRIRNLDAVTQHRVVEQTDNRLGHRGDVGGGDEPGKTGVQEAARSLFSAHAGSAGRERFDYLDGGTADTRQRIDRHRALPQQL